MFFKKHHLASALCAACITSLNAEVTYVDADFTTNTTLTDGTELVVGTIGYTDPDGGADDLWGLRGFGNNATILQGGIDEDAPRLRTSITGLTEGESYNIFAYFWGAGGTGINGLWRGRGSLAYPVADIQGYNTVHFAGSAFLPMAAISSPSRTDAAVLNPDALSTADESGFENGGYFSSPVLTEEDDRRLYQVHLGVVVADATGVVHVYIDDLANTGQGNRTWYDGVGHELTTPLPPGEITYIDATSNNITRWDEQPFLPAGQGNETIDNNWETRLFGNNGEVYESNADGAEDAPLLKLTLTDLTPETDYVLYAYFWRDGLDWRLKASVNPSDIDDNGTPTDLTDDFLPSSPLTSFAPLNNGLRAAAQAPLTRAIEFITPPLITEGNRFLHQGRLGTASSDPSGEISIYIDDFAGVTGVNRTWFDGVGYKEASALDPTADEDGDTLSNSEEESVGTSPYIADSDGDSYSDALEITASTDPLDASSAPPLPGNSVAIAPDGVWTWFNDERAIWHLGKLYSGYVLSNGQYGITQYDPVTNTSSHSVISTINSNELDDHNNPSICVLPDNRLLIVYSKHITDDNFYHRTSLVTEPSTYLDWGPELVFDTSVGVDGPNNTYANTYRLSGESDLIYNFYRSINFNPTITTSSDNGASWNNPVHFINTGSGGTRPYPRYCSNNLDRIDLIYTDGHPRDDDNSVYHMFYKAGNFHKTDGTIIDSIANLPLEHDAGQRGSVVYLYSDALWGDGDGPDDWIPSGRGWTWDLHYGNDGNPVCVFQVQRDNVTGSGWNHDRIYYYYARWNGTNWQRKFIAQGGRGIYASEDDYGGGMAIDPNNPNVIYVSSNAANPFSLQDIDDVPLGINERYEIYRGTTNDGGLTFNWETITENSDQDNLRPIVPTGHNYENHALWFSGDYNSYQNFDAAVLGIFSNELSGRVTIIDSNWTTNGATFTWNSKPSMSYDIKASLDLQTYDIHVASGIPSQGASTTQSFAFPPEFLNKAAAFLRVEETSSE